MTDDQETQKEEKPEVKEEVKTVEEKPEVKKPPSMIDDAKKAADSLREQNDRMEANIKKQEEMLSEQALAGRSNAGGVEEKPKEETNREFSERLRTGNMEPSELINQ